MIYADYLRPTSMKKVQSFGDGKYNIIEYIKDMSVDPSSAQLEYFLSEMNVHKKQLAINIDNDAVILQAGAMQWMAGNINVRTDIKGAGDLAKKMFGSKVTSESAIKPKYEGSGTIVLEPTYKHILVCDMKKDWSGGIVLEDGLFLACDASIDSKVVSRKTLSSAVLGNEGLFNLCLTGNGMFALESTVPRSEVVEVQLDDDVLKIDGPFAFAWSPSLKFTVEKTTKSLVGSAASGEGLVNVYRGTGKIWMAPIR